jgi:hypothetical protein
LKKPNEDLAGIRKRKTKDTSGNGKEKGEKNYNNALFNY